MNINYRLSIIKSQKYRLFGGYDMHKL